MIYRSKKIQPEIKTGVSERTLQVEVVLPARKKRGREVTQVSTKQVLEYLEVMSIAHGKLLSGPDSIDNRDGEKCACWVFEKRDLRVKHVTTKPSKAGTTKPSKAGTTKKSK